MSMTQETTTEHPSLAEEIERKTVEELQRLVHAHQQARLSTTEASQCLQTLWQTTAGLVSKETMELITRAIAEVKGLAPETAMDDVRVVHDQARSRILVGVRRRGVFITIAAPISDAPVRTVKKGDDAHQVGPEFDAFDKMGKFKKLTSEMSRIV